MSCRSAIQRLRLRLYVSGGTDNSTAAVANLRELLAVRVDQEACELEVIDVLREPGRALEDGVLVTPTLVRTTPVPTKRIVGTLSDPELVLRILLS